MAFPVVVGALGAIATVPALVLTEVVENGVSIVEGIAQIDDKLFTQNYMRKRLALELSRNYTTDTKNINGSIIPETFSKDRSEQIERLTQATLNQNKFR